MFPVRVILQGLSGESQRGAAARQAEFLFDPAGQSNARRRARKSRRIRMKGGRGRNSDFVEEAAGGAPKATQDAFKLIAVLMQHRRQQAATAAPRLPR